jgi:hypothetical protein
MKMKRIVSSAVMGVLLVTTGSLAWAEEKDEKDLSAYQWGYWDKMVSPAAGPLAPVGVTVSTTLPSPPQPTPNLIPPTPDPVPPPPLGGGSWIGDSTGDFTFGGLPNE